MRILISGSNGQGIYPPSSDKVLTEDSPVGTDFLARLQCDGEAATAPASAAGIRVVNLRIPTVVGDPSIRGGPERFLATTARNDNCVECNRNRVAPYIVGG